MKKKLPRKKKQVAGGKPLSLEKDFLVKQFRKNPITFVLALVGAFGSGSAAKLPARPAEPASEVIPATEKHKAPWQMVPTGTPDALRYKIYDAAREGLASLSRGEDLGKVEACMVANLEEALKDDPRLLSAKIGAMHPVVRTLVPRP